MRKPWQYCRHPGTPCPACSTANQLPAKARAGGASQQDGTGAMGQTDVSYRAVLGRSWSLLTLHPAGPALCKALELPAKSTCATPHPARPPAAQRCLGLGFAGCKVFPIIWALLSPCCSPLLGQRLMSGHSILREFSGSMQKIWELCFTSPQRDDLVGMSLNKTLEYFK